MRNFTSRLNNGYKWIFNFAYLNLLWLATIILLLVVFGLFPATVALFTIIRKWVMGEKEFPIFQTFFNAVKESFLKSNIMGLLIVGSGYIIYLNVILILENGITANLFLLFSQLLLIFIYLNVLIYIFPLYVHFELTIYNYIKYSIIIGILNFHMSFFLILSIAAFVVVTFILPGLLLFFSGSMTAYIIMSISYKIIIKIEGKKIE